MPEVPADLSYIRDAAAARRRMRRDLRRCGQAVGAELVELLRVGDRVELPRADAPESILYTVIKVKWWARLMGDDEDRSDSEQAPSPEPCLIRSSEARICALTDPREHFSDEYGNLYEPRGREVIAADDEVVVRGTAIHLATDCEFILFSQEAAAVAQSFAHSLRDEQRVKGEAVAQFQAFKGEKS